MSEKTSIHDDNMPTCQNLKRNAARVWWEYLSPKENAWISIGEPDIPDSEVSNNILDSLPRLKISFWDVTETYVDETGDEYPPPSEKDAAQIVDFILQNRGKNFIINCAAGKSRSAAVCAFLEKNLGYKWTNGKEIAKPNKLLVRLMEEYYYA